MDALVTKHVLGELTLGELWGLITNNCCVRDGWLQRHKEVRVSVSHGQYHKEDSEWSVHKGRLNLDNTIIVSLGTRIKVVCGSIMIPGKVDTFLSFPGSNSASIVLSSFE